MQTGNSVLQLGDTSGRPGSTGLLPPLRPVVTTPARFPDLSGIIICRARTPRDIERALDVRWQGYHKYSSSRDHLVDSHDAASNCTLLLATDLDDHPLGTLRILDRSTGAIELDSYIAVTSVLPSDLLPCAEATRFSVPAHPKSRLLKLALWKAYWNYCRFHHINSMVIWVRPGAARDYLHLGFLSAGPLGVFRHSLLGNIEHSTYFLDIRTAKSHPLYEFFCAQHLSSISFG